MDERTDALWQVPDAEVAAAIGPTTLPMVTGLDALSPYEYLLRALESHIGAERNALTHYRQLSEGSSDPVVQLVMGIILEDEERHHALMRRLATRLQDDLYWQHSPDALPIGTPDQAKSEDLEALRTFISSEQHGTHELEEFARQARGLYQGLPSELLEMMALDSQKHERLLRFLFHRLSETVKA